MSKATTAPTTGLQAVGEREPWTHYPLTVSPEVNAEVYALCAAAWAVLEPYRTGSAIDVHEQRAADLMLFQHRVQPSIANEVTMALLHMISGAKRCASDSGPDVVDHTADYGASSTMRADFHQVITEAAKQLDALRELVSHEPDASDRQKLVQSLRVWPTSTTVVRESRVPDVDNSPSEDSRQLRD